MNLDDVVGEALNGQLIDRRRVLLAGGLGIGVVASRLALRRLSGSAMAQSTMSAAQLDVAVSTLQTAASLENVMIATYTAVLHTPFVAGNAAIRRFVETTLQQHAVHGDMFNAEAERRGGERQDGSNPKYAHYVDTELPAVVDTAGMVDLAATLEEVATDTYLANLAASQDAPLQNLMASVMGVEAQHLATLRIFGTLIAAGSPELAAFPTDTDALPPAVGWVAFPLALEVPNFARPPDEGAVR